MDKNAVKQFSVDLDTQDFINAIKVLGISGSEICIHSSMKSFGADFKCGIKGIIDSFLILL